MERKQQLWFWQITKNIGEAGDKSALLLLTKIAAPSPIPLRMLTLIAALLVGVAPALAASAVVEPTMPSQKTVVDLVQQGKAFYEAGQFAEAAKVLQPAAETFKNQGDRLQQAIALSNLSLAYQQLGQWTEATRAIAASLQILQTGSDRLKLLAQALDVQGRLQFSQGQLESALSTWQQAATTYSQAGDDLGSIRAQINQAQVQQLINVLVGALHGGQPAGVLAGQGFGTGTEE